MTGKIQHEIEGLLSDISKLISEVSRLEDRVHSLEIKIGNTTINSLQNRMTNFQEDIAKINNRLSSVETELGVRLGKWTCPNCNFEFENLAEFLEHIIANINDLERKLEAKTK